MKEILYIAKIDIRPWIKSNVGDSLIPFLLLFASVETTRNILNENARISELNRYFVIVIAAVAIVHLGRFLPRQWHGRYMIKFLQDLIYSALISTALFNAFWSLFRIRWSLLIDPAGNMPDWQVRLIVAFVMSCIGVIYLAIQTTMHRRAGFKKNPTPHRLIARLREKEAHALVGVYATHFILVSALLGFLILKGLPS